MTVAARPKRKPQPETTVLRAVRAFLETGGWLTYRHQAGPMSPLGFPDLWPFAPVASSWSKSRGRRVV